jgi:DNA transformation protein
MIKSVSTSRKQEVARRMVELMAGFAAVQAKPMFGGHGIYWQGLMFGLLAHERLYLKADAQSMAAFTARGLRPFTVGPPSKPVSLKYYEAPDEVYDEPEHMAHWARMAYECAVRQQKPAKGAAMSSGKRSGQPAEHRAADAASGTVASRSACSPSQAAGTQSLSALANLGPKSEEMLCQAGIRTEAQLRELGSVVAYARTKAACRGASLNLLWALEGALSGRTWQEVAETDRATLLMALEDVQRQMQPGQLARRPRDGAV